MYTMKYIESLLRILGGLTTGFAIGSFIQGNYKEGCIAGIIGSICFFSISLINRWLYLTK